MRPLLPNFERELDAFRTRAGAFADRYPKVARRLRIDPDASAACGDPHVERLIEAFALLAARVHRKLDDEYPGIVEAFMQMLYPHYPCPVPSATILQLIPADPARPVAVPRGTLALSPAIQGIRCGFRTTWDLELLPVAVTGAALEVPSAQAAATLVLDLETLGGVPFPRLRLDRLRFFLDGEPPLMHLLYELLALRVHGIQLCGPGAPAPATLPASALRPAGFQRDEALFAWDDRSCQGFRLLSEYFAFPDKFMFFELSALGGALERLGTRMTLRIALTRFGAGERHRRLQQTLSAASFRLGCVPAVNLFPHPGAPIIVTHRQASYPVRPEGPRPQAYGIHAIDEVVRTVQGAAGEVSERVSPFYAVRHGDQDPDPTLYWHAAREPGPRPDQDGGMELTLVDLPFRTLRPERETLTLRLTCTNRNLPASLPFGGGSAVQEDFTLPALPALRARARSKPTPSLPPPGRRGLQWRIVAHLALGQLAMAGRDREPLRELLELYRRAGTPAAALQVQGILQLRARPCSVRIPGRESSALVRGTELAITFDESCYVGSSLHLFATVLERCFGHLCGPNRFVKVRMFTLQQEGEVAQWPPRNGAMTWT
jgi:type VI secretion system protein ImpG